MPRISLPAPETMNPEQRAVYDKIISGPRGRIQGPLRAALHNPELADKWQAIGALLRYGTTLTPRQSEIAILVTGRACNSPFEWYAHRAEAEKAGIEQPIIEARFVSKARRAGADALIYDPIEKVGEEAHLFSAEDKYSFKATMVAYK